MRTVSLAVVAVAAALGCASQRPAWNSSPLVGKAVPIEAHTLDGRLVRLPESGAKVTVVDFWATWCEPCRDQMPQLDRLSTALRDRGAQFYAISFDEDRSAVEEFIARTPVQFPVLWEKGGTPLAEKLSLTRLPTTVVLDGAGVVRAVHVGYDDAQSAELEREVRRVLDEDQRAPGAAPAAPAGGS